ncbi:MAG: NAD(P)-binding protein [Lachnospiraceae bacterium]|nr:NAD(P)-binding protein [Lachnospiraceae bacterium]MDY5742889.1 NAD(P)-binding protein [Lachnospiraceae bacterium]
MGRLYINTKNSAQKVIEDLYKDLERRVVASPVGICPIDVSSAFIKMCHAQTCGKCVPCRIGLGQISKLMDDVLEGNASLETIDLIQETAQVVSDSADCAIGYEAANMVLKGIAGFRDDYEEHILHNRCTMNTKISVPCVSLCPANVDVPGYIALIREGRFADAVKLIRKDNPFPSACGLVCEHPCEERCRRNILDDSINIRGLKRVAVEKAGDVPVPTPKEETGKKVAIIGAGPSGLSCAFYLRLMGHRVTVFEKNNKLGGMLRYGIPSYRLPREVLDREIDALLSTGIEVKRNIEFNNDFVGRIKEAFDATYIAIGAHTDKKLNIEGEDATGVISAVSMLKQIGDEDYPDFTGKRVVVIGGGNVAMDVVRTSIRLGADSVTCVYRRRIEDMTALPEEIKGAIAEGAEMMTLMAPVKIEKDEQNQLRAVYLQKQIISTVKDCRPTVRNAKAEPVRLECDVLIVSIGQNIESRVFQESGVPVKKGVIDALNSTDIEQLKGFFAGGDCVSGPATVIKAIEAGKVAARNIDEYLGFSTELDWNIDIPEAVIENKTACGRVNMKERAAAERKSDMELMEYCMSDEEAMQESGRCLRCDHFGYGSLRGGRIDRW